MKQLVLLRHAKSDWAIETLRDIDRPLNRRGYEDAYLLSAEIKKQNIIPHFIVSSPATRALSTALIFARELDFPQDKIHIVPQIYEADVNTLKQLVRAFPADADTVFLVGHNPGFTDFFNEICNSRIDNLPTCGLMLIQWEEKKWEDVFLTKGKLIYYQFPKILKG